MTSNADRGNHIPIPLELTHRYKEDMVSNGYWLGEREGTDVVSFNAAAVGYYTSSLSSGMNRTKLTLVFNSSGKEVVYYVFETPETIAKKIREATQVAYSTLQNLQN
jgi:hypothetical protein